MATHALLRQKGVEDAAVSWYVRTGDKRIDQVARRWIQGEQILHGEKLFCVHESHTHCHASRPTFNGALPSLTDFVPFRRSFSADQVVVTGALRRVGDLGLLFEVRVQEDDLIQDVLVEAKPARAAHADVIVSVSTFGQPLATRGTRGAVMAIEQWLTGSGMQTAETYY